MTLLAVSLGSVSLSLAEIEAIPFVRDPQQAIANRLLELIKSKSSAPRELEQLRELLREIDFLVSLANLSRCDARINS